jgi:NADPH2:quinone reductase
MRAVTLQSWGSAPQVVSIDAPTWRPGHSLIRIEAATVGHLDATVASGSLGVSPGLPYIPGVEGAGTVIESESWSPGTRVTVRGAGVGITSNGTWCESALVPDEALMDVPPEMDMSLAACYFVPTTTAHAAVHEICKAGPGMKLLITGSGGAVGGLSVQMSLRAGAHVIALTRRKMELAQSWVGNVRLATYEDDLASICDLPVDACVDTVAGDHFASRLAGIAPGGLCALVGYAGGSRVIQEVPSWIMSDVTVVPVNMLRRESSARAAAPELARLLSVGELTLAVTEYPATEAAQALSDVTHGEVEGRAVIRFDQ